MLLVKSIYDSDDFEFIILSSYKGALRTNVCHTLTAEGALTKNFCHA